MSSGPDALFSLMFRRSLRTPFSAMWIVCSLLRGGSSVVQVVAPEGIGSGVEKTLQNCSLRTFALPSGSVIK